MSDPRTRHRAMLAASVLTSLLVLSGCSLIANLGGGPDVSRDAQTQEVTEGGTADVFSLRVGDCLDTAAASTSDEVSQVTAVPCDQTHDDEIFHEFEMPVGDFPGTEALDAAATEECEPAFATFVGLSYEESVLDYYPFEPTEGSWNELDDRLVQCAVYEPGVRLEGSLAGVAR